MNQLLIVSGLLLLSERVIKWLMINHFFEKSKDVTSTKTEGIDKISILQPILSGDPTLWNCLAQNLMMQTPYQIEFIWLIDDNDPEAQIGCRQLIESYPQATVKLISLPPPANQISPKLFKLIEGLKVAEGNIIAILDDDTLLPDEAFEQCLPYLEKPNVGVAFGLPYYVNFSNFWSSLVSSVVNGNDLLTYIPYTYLIKPFTINGMFFVIKRDILLRVNGFSDLDKYIVDDYAIAEHFRKHGYELAQTPVCHGISTQIHDSQHYFNLITRWFVFPQASILKAANLKELGIFYLMAFLPTLLPLLVILGCLFFPSIYSIFYLVIYFSFNYYMLSQFNQTYLRKATPTPLILGLIIVQIFLPFQIILSLFAPRRINWRGHIMQIKDDGGFDFVQRRDSVS